MSDIPMRDKIINELCTKTVLEQQVFNHTVASFSLIEEILQEITQTYNAKLKHTAIQLEFTKVGNYDLQLKIGSDILIFSMHSNVFQFNKENIVWKHSYMKNNPENGYVGQICIYNFLADSYTYKRENDLGYLIARIFINRENHYLVEGKRQVSFHNNDISESSADRESLTNIIETAIHYAIHFDLLVPPYEAIKIASVRQMVQKAKDSKLTTGKRLGFQFNTDDI